MKSALVLAIGACLFSFSAFAQTPAPMPECNTLGTAAPTMQTQMVLGDYYPTMSVYLGEEGNTVVGFVVRKNGTVSDVQVMGSSGSARLDNAAMQAMQQMLYSPPKANGAAVDCHNRLRLVWKLTGDKANEQKYLLVQPPLSAYPPEALREHREGAAVVYVAIAPSGEVTADLKRSSGSDDLDTAAIEFVQSRKFKPAEMDGTPRISFVAIIVAWELESSKPAERKSK